MASHCRSATCPTTQSIRQTLANLGMRNVVGGQAFATSTLRSAVLPGWASASSAAHYGPSDVAFKGLAAAADESPIRRLPQPARDKRVARRQIEGFIRHARRTSRREN